MRGLHTRYIIREFNAEDILGVEAWAIHTVFFFTIWEPFTGVNYNIDVLSREIYTFTVWMLCYGSVGWTIWMWIPDTKQVCFVLFTIFFSPSPNFRMNLKEATCTWYHFVMNLQFFQTFGHTDFRIWGLDRLLNKFAGQRLVHAVKDVGRPATAVRRATIGTTLTR